MTCVHAVISGPMETEQQVVNDYVEDTFTFTCVHVDGWGTKLNCESCVETRSLSGVARALQ